MRVLLVEDSSRLRASLGIALRASGHVVDETGEGREALWMINEHPHDAVVLDIMLPGLSGLEILTEIRRKGLDVPVLLLTARDTVEDRVRGLRMGADDYLVKPFALDELLARVDVLCRRRHGRASGIIRLGEIELDTSAKTVKAPDGEISVTVREFRLLELLASRRGEVLSRQEIETHIFDDRAEVISNVVDSSVCLLRGKLKARGHDSIIQTRRGHGYVIE